MGLFNGLEAFLHNISHSPAATIPTQPTFLPHLHAKTTAASRVLETVFYCLVVAKSLLQMLRHAIDFFSFARKKNCLLDGKLLLNEFPKG
jgi:hypothetical protein